MAILMFGVAIALGVTSVLLPISAYADANCAYNSLECVDGQCTLDNASICENGTWLSPQQNGYNCPSNDCSRDNCAGGSECNETIGE